MLSFLKSNLVFNKINILTLFVSPIIMVLGIVLLNKNYESLDGIETIFLSLSLVLSLSLITGDLKYSYFTLSLPTNRKLFILSKYILLFLYGVILLLLIILESYFLFNLFGFTLSYTIIFQNILLIVSIILTISSLFIPLNIFFLNKENRFIMGLNIFIPMMLPVIIINNFSSINHFLSIIIFLFTIIINIISYVLTKHFFKNYNM